MAETDLRELGSHAFLIKMRNPNLDVDHVFGEKSRNGCRTDVLDGTAISNVQTTQRDAERNKLAVPIIPT